MNSIAATRSAAWGLAWLTGIACWSSVVSAQTSGIPTESPTSLNFRRVFAPADRVDEWPRGKIRYVPVEPQEFERLIEAANNATVGAPVSAGARLKQAHYDIKLTAAETLLGKATWDITSASQTPLLMPLEPLGFAITSAVWENSTSKPTIGLAGNGQSSVLVEKPGKLLVDWSLRGQRDSADAINFQLSLPRCADTTLIVELPADMVLLSSRGIVELEPNAPDGRKLWRITSGGQNRLGLRIVPESATSEHRRLTLLRDTLSTYEFSPRSVELTSLFNLDVLHEPLGRLELSVDAGLQLVAARYGETAVPWSARHDPETGATKVSLELPEPILGAGRPLRLAAIAPLVLGHKWRLPRIHVPGAFWQEGNMRMLIPAPLLLEELTPVHCRQSKTGPLPAPLQGQSLDLQCDTADATTEVLLAHRRERFQLSSGTLLNLESGQVRGQMLADLKLPAGERFNVQADVPEGWSIDTIESVPAGVVDDWRLSDKKRLLSIRLHRALRADRPLRLLVSGRRLTSALGMIVRAANLRMLDFRETHTDKNLICLRTTGNHLVRLVDADDLPRLDAPTLPVSQRDLFAEAPRGIVVEFDPVSAQWGVVLERQSPRFSADIRVDATATTGPLIESYAIRCLPEATRIEQVFIHFSRARDEPLRWSLVNSPTGPAAALGAAPAVAVGEVTSRRLPKDPPGTTADNAGETWEVTLRHPRTAPFELRATRSSTWNEQVEISLASLPEAVNQQRKLIVHAATDEPLTISNTGLQSIPVEATRDHQFVDARAAFRYETPDEGSQAAAAGVRLSRPADGLRQMGAIVWNCNVESRLGTDGRGLHTVTYQIQNTGRNQCSISLAAGSHLLELWVDDQRLTPRYEGSNDAMYVPLPAGRKFPTIVAQYVTDTAIWETLTNLELTLPGSDLPILSKRFTVWLPAGYEMLDSAQHWQALDTRPLTWTQRIFGPFGRPASEQPFRPDSVDEWSSSFADHDIDAVSLNAAQDFLTKLGTEASLTPGAETLQWGNLLSRVESSSAMDRRLLVDARALAEAGITPQATVRLNTSIKTTSIERGTAFLTQAGLMLLVDADAILLTSSTAAKLQQSQLMPLDAPAMRWVRRGPITTQISAGLDGKSEHCQTLQKWLAHANSVWKAIPTSARMSEANGGWTSYRWEGSHDQLLRICIVQTAALQSAAWGVFWMVLAIAWWRLRHSAKWLAASVCLFAIIACWIPDRFSLLASAAVLGSLAAIALRWLDPRPHLNQDKEQSPLSRSSKIEAVLPVALFLGMLFTALRECGTVRGAELPATLPPDVHSVFIPIDAEGKPTGERYMVPEPLHSALRRMTAIATEEPLGSLISGAEYQVALLSDGNDARATAAQCSARFDVRVLSPGAKVRLPLGRAAANLVPDTALLDRRPIELSWDEEGRMLECEIQDVGQYQLELTLRPAIISTGGFHGFDVPIPAVPNAKLELSIPAPFPLVEVPLAQGNIERITGNPTRLLAHMGSASRLVVRWPDNANGRGAETLSDVEELLWLKVRPGSVVLDARCKVRMLQGQMRELRFAVDPRLRLLPWEAQNPAISEITVEAAAADSPGSPHTLHCKLARPLTDQTTVLLSFLWTGASGVGNLRVPLLESRDGRSTRRWLAVSVDPVLDFEAAEDKQLVPLAIPEFSAQWGPATAPQIAFQLPRGDVRWSLGTRPRPPRTTVQQNLAISIQRGRTNIIYDARLNTTEGYVFQHRLQAPAELEVESILITEEGGQRVARWASDAQGLITVFLTGPVGGRQELILRGRMPAPISGQMTLPGIHIEQAETEVDNVYLYRRPAVLLTVENMEGWSESVDPVKVDAQKEMGRLVKSLTGSGENRSTVLRIEPNVPRARWTQVTTLKKEANEWELLCDCRCRVEQGLVDEFRWQIPAAWVGPFEITPPAAHEVVESAGDTPRQLIVRPRSAIQGEFGFTVRGGVEFPPGERLVAPNITPLGMLAGERFLVLPTQLGVQQVAWQTAQLKPSVLPQEFNTPAEGFLAYRVSGANPQASIKTVARNEGPAQVLLADYHLLWHAEGTCHALVNFDLDPAGATSCTLRMPSECQLVQVRVAGLSTTPTKVSEGEWKLPLSGGSLPVRVQVVYQGRLTFPATPWGDKTATLPMLGNFRVAQTLVTLYGPPGSESADDRSHESAKDQIGDLQADLLRYEVIANISDLPADLAGELRTDDLAGWFQPWARRSQILRAAIRERLTLQRREEKMPHWQGQLNAIEQKQRQAMQRLGINSAAESAAGNYLPGESPEDFLQHSFAGEHFVRRYQFSSGAAPASLQLGKMDQTDWFRRALWSSALLGAFGLLVIAGRRGALDDWSRRWPHVLGVMAGVAWWLWLTPSIFGWVLIFGSLLASMRPAWKATRDSPSALQPRP